MPYKSEAQRKFFNSSEGKAKLGKEEVEKWNEESKGQKDLPNKISDLQKAIKICDDTWEQHKYKSNPPDRYKWKYSVRARYGNKTEHVYGPKQWPSQSKNFSYVKNELTEWVRKTGQRNYEPYNITFLGTYK